MSRLRLFLFTLLYAFMFSTAGLAQDAATDATQPTPTVNDEAPATDAAADDSTGDEVAAEPSVADAIDAQFGVVVKYMEAVLFWDPIPGEDISIPLIVLILLLGSTFFTFYHGWLNIRGFRHAVDVTCGKFDNPNDPGEISHFQALTSALSATVGLGNIAGVALAIQAGGPGAVVWMMLLGILGMTAKFNECTLAQVYRKIKPDGTVHGGPMYYLEIGLQERGLPWVVAKGFGIVFAIFCIGGSFGGGNMFQANQATLAVTGMIEATGITSESDDYRGVVGGVLAFLVGLVIIGGIRRIGRVTERIIPFMCGVYMLAGVTILVTHRAQIPDAVSLILRSCIAPEAAYGGFIGVLVIGIKRAVFSNEAGVGSAAIAHAAAKTDEPVREGIVAMLGPFIDTVIICTMTALVVIVSGAYKDPNAGEGVEITQLAFASAAPWFPLVLGASVFLFAYSTMISWSYYGEKAWQYIFGQSQATLMIYRIIFLMFIVLGAITSLKNVMGFSDLMILSMAFPNVIGGIILAPKVKALLKDYWARFKNNEFKNYS